MHARQNGEMTNELDDRREHARIFLRRQQTPRRTPTLSLQRVENALHRLRDRRNR
jgi:hypothetical protein